MADINKLIALKNELRALYTLVKQTETPASHDLQIQLFLTIANIERKIRWYHCPPTI
ncbi:MAG: hypothetical protein ACYDCW_15610 [Acidithiobacillus ferrivorans]